MGKTKNEIAFEEDIDYNGRTKYSVNLGFLRSIIVIALYDKDEEVERRAKKYYFNFDYFITNIALMITFFGIIATSDFRDWWIFTADQIGFIFNILLASLSLLIIGRFLVVKFR